MFKVKSRWQAFGVHILISLLIFFILLYVIVFVWYPNIFINMGGYQGIKIVAGVDLVLGPILTLIIFNPEKTKRHITLDICVIAFCQFSALAAGTWLIYKERPLVQVLSIDGVHIHTASDFIRTKTNIETIKLLPASLPKIAFLDLPESSEGVDHIKYLTKAIQKKPITLRADLYLPLNSVDKHILKSRLDKFKFNQTENCYEVSIYSFHNFGKTCFHLEEGPRGFKKSSRPKQ